MATYSYDALNRLTTSAYQVGGVTDQTISYSYDTGTNAKGHLTGASDANHSMAWAYDPQGRVTGRGQTVAGITLGIGYHYTNADLTTLTTPSGQTITYSYSNHQITGITVNSATLLSSANYEPLGPVSGWTWGNSTTEVRSHNADGNPYQFGGPETVTLSYDNAFRITSATNNMNSALSWSYSSYDNLDRITGATQSGTALGWDYNGDGDRLHQTGASTPSPLWTSGPTSTYNAQGRMTSVTASGTTTNYIYNALGQLIDKSNSTTTLLAYDEAGHIIGEYESNGALIQETVWLGDTPVATLRPNGGSSIAIYYVHADQLGAPRSITRPSDNAIVWRWDADPYGTAVANQNPSGIGTFVYNLRFPGQYYQSETGLDYNYERDYDPNAGRYVESDPIGLFGGSFSTYAYVGGNPVSRTDLFGLMCTPGFGCYTTPAEAAAAQSGNYLGYYQLACAGGDGYACFAEHIAANDNEWGHLATDRLLEALGKEGICGVAADAIVDEIRTELADAYAAYLPNDPAKAILPDADAIAAFHADVFANYGLPSSTFGGTPLGSAVGVIGAGIWCPNCGLPHTVHPMH